MRYLYSNIQSFLQDESGVTSIEYGMVASLIAVVILAAVATLGTQVCERFRSVATALGAVGVAACP
jgi:pilus assembly protein Flp/PilA